MAAKQPKTEFKELLASHPAWIIGSIIVVAFTAGVGADEWLRAPGIEELARYRALGASPEQLKGKLDSREATTTFSSTTPPSLKPTGGASWEEKEKNRLKSEERLEELRQRNKTRRLRDIENELPVRHLPNGVYAFLNSTSVDRFLPLDQQPNEQWSADRSTAVSQDRQFPGQLELHKLQDGSLNVVGFVSEGDLQRIESPPGKGRVILYEQSWEEAQAMVTIPLARVTSVWDRKFRNFYLYELDLRSQQVAQATIRP